MKIEKIDSLFVPDTENDRKYDLLFIQQSDINSKNHSTKIITQKYLHFATFYNISFLNLKFSHCDFKHCTYENFYARGVIFENIDFTGSQSINCNFDNIKFINCNFQHCRFQNCILPVREISAALPNESNLKKKLATNLKINFQNIGMQSEADHFLDIEIESEIGDLKSVILGETEYYKSHYQTFDRILALLKFIMLKIEIFIWGYGHKVKNLIISYSCILLYPKILFLKTKRLNFELPRIKPAFKDETNHQRRNYKIVG
ncbi:pentapeptide repeat-containing protein, partial [Arcicella sp. DC2W]